MDVHDAHGDALLEILRCGEAHIEADRKDERGDRRQPWHDLVGQPNEARRVGKVHPAAQA
ncbi:hypothetical protein ACVINZ_006410 [Mesorhizobium jarvisii]